MKNIIQILLFTFSLQIAFAQTDEIWHTANHEMVQGVQEAKDYGVWVYGFNNPDATGGSELKKMSRDGIELMKMDFADGLVLSHIYEYGNGNLFLGLNTLDLAISDLSVSLFIIIDEFGNRIKEHLYYPHPDSTMNEHLDNQLGYGFIKGLIPVDETDLATDVILLGYASIGWDDPINPATEYFPGNMIGMERVDHLGNRIWTKRIAGIKNWTSPFLRKLKDGNMLMTTNAIVYPNAPDSTIHRDGTIMMKMDMDGNIIWQNNTIIENEGYYRTTRPRNSVELASGNIITPISIGMGGGVYKSAILHIDANGITQGFTFVGDTTNRIGYLQMEAFDSNTLIYTTAANLTQGPGPAADKFNVYMLDTLGTTLHHWRSSVQSWITKATMVPHDKQGFYTCPTNWYSGSRTKVLKFTDSLTAYVDGVDTFTYNTTQNDNLDGVFIDLEYYDLLNYLDSLKSIGVEENPIQSLSIYPNPASVSSKLQMPEQFTQGKIELFKINGQLLYSANWLQEHGDFNLPVSKLESGTYIVKMTTPNNEKWSGKLEVVKNE